MIDSLGMLKLVSVIEEEFDLEIDDDDIVPDNWRTIRDIAGSRRGKTVVEKTEGAPGGAPSLSSFSVRGCSELEPPRATVVASRT